VTNSKTAYIVSIKQDGQQVKIVLFYSPKMPYIHQN